LNNHIHIQNIQKVKTKEKLLRVGLQIEAEEEILDKGKERSILTNLRCRISITNDQKILKNI